mgnify:FL=1
MNVSASVIIDCPQSDVFAFVSDVSNMPAWVSGVTRARMLSDEMHEGALFTCEYTRNWRGADIELRVFTFDPPNTLGTEMARGPFSFEGRLELEAVEGGTRVTNYIVADPDSLSTRFAAMVFGPFTRSSMRKRLTRELEALAAAVKGDATKGADA